MATINFRLQGKSNPAPIYLRFKNGNSTDIETKTGLLISPQYWDKSKQRIRNVIDVPNRVDINEKIGKLHLHIIDQFNVSLSIGKVIDKDWLKKTIEGFFNRPIQKGDGKIDIEKFYFSDYCLGWLKNRARIFKVSSSKYMDDTTISHYSQVVDNFINFEGKKKYLIKDINSETIDRFSNYLADVENYSESTVKRKLGRVKFFCKRASGDNLEVDNSYQERVFVKKAAVKYKQPYLNEEEIDRIFKYDFSYNESLDNVRDNLIIALWTGLRVSDFLVKLKINNFKDGFIDIQTEKTKTWVSIPIHNQVKFILEKRKGQLPRKISITKFNDYIKDVGQIVEIDNEMIGGISKVDSKGVKRKVVDTYKKYELITSHIGRRSMATNLFGKVPNKVIMDICGWKSEQQMLDYNKQTNRESALILKEYWDKKY